MALWQDGTAFPIQQETPWEAAVSQTMGNYSDVERMEEPGLTELIQPLRKEKL